MEISKLNKKKIEDIKIGIVGMGLMGASMAEGFTREGHTVYGVDINKKSLEYCENKGIIEKGFEDPRGILGEIDLLIMAIYPKGMIGFTKKYSMFFNKDMVMIDICGIKQSFIDEIQDLTPKGCEFVGTHPMAGREMTGPEYGDSNIFRGANFILTPTERNTEKAVSLVEEVAKGLNFGKISRLTPKRHDNIIAFTSQLTHAIAVALVNSDKDEDTYSFTGDSYRDLTRIAMINEDLWSELFLENKENLMEKIEEFQKKLEVIKEALVEDDAETLKEEFRKSTLKRKQLKPKKNHIG